MKYRILYYNSLDYNDLELKFNKVIGFLQDGDFKSAEVKKLKPTGYFRAKLDVTNRLLFKPVKYNGQFYFLILEVIRNHDYNKSRFLRGAKLTEEEMIAGLSDLDNYDLLSSVPENKSVHLLDKFIVFNEQQEEVFNYGLPLIIIGSAGSGKTSVTLEKLKGLEGKILYTSLSEYLVRNSQKIYFSFNYYNDRQNIDFLSFKEFLETMEIPEGQQVSDSIFLQWLRKQNLAKTIGDGRKVFEEFIGVIVGSSVNEPYLAREDYLALGVKQSIFLQNQREEIYSLFQKYIEFLDKEKYYDSNIITYKYNNLARNLYDAVVVDEVQDFTNRQLSLLLKSLKDNRRDNRRFLLCGDANQIVHPNFFSWSKLKSFFYNDETLSTHNHDIIKILTANYRSTLEVTELANRVLRFKNYRFGSIDKESHYLVESTSERHGSVSCLEARPDIIKEINSKTSKSISYAILVLHDHCKQKAMEIFNSPLIFTVQEAKGLEYDNIILYDFISHERSYDEISENINKEFLTSDFKYSRPKEKEDKSLEIYKFYINALYVAITRSIQNVYILESNPAHKFLRLLDINQIKEINIKAEESSREDWQKEANKLITQGKQEQAKAIEDSILRHKVVSWKPVDLQELDKLRNAVLEQNTHSKKDAIKLLNYAIIYSNSVIIKRLQDMGLKAAGNIAKSIPIMLDEYFSDYIYQNTGSMLKKIDQFGTDFRNEFNLTPLMSAVYVGRKAHVEALLSLGASLTALDNNRRNAFMIAISRAISDAKYCTGFFCEIYEHLKPDSVTLKTSNKLVKIEAYKSEYFLVYFLLTGIMNNKYEEEEDILQVFSAGDISKVLSIFSEDIIPDYRKNKVYIRSLLARNEVNGNYPYNKRLFRRIRPGIYSLNPELQIKLDGSNWESLLVCDEDYVSDEAVHC